MFKEVLQTLGSIIWDGAKFIGEILSGVFIFGYIFSGYGLIFLLPTLPALLGSIPYTLEWLVCLVFVVSILGSWIRLLVIEIIDRINQQKKITCPHCKKQGGLAAMFRWHFDNCKLK